MLRQLRKQAIACSAVLVMGLSLSSPARAGIPVIDVSNLAQAIQQVLAWGQQYQHYDVDPART
jgi:type IV secretion system protein VirB5